MAKRNGNNDKPMMDINTTPLIDVMLVPLIMFVISLPRPTHAVKADLAIGTVQLLPDPVKNRLAIMADGTLTWNGTAVDMITLRAYLDQTATMVPEPELQFQPDPRARYARVDETMATIKHAGVTKMGFVGNEQYYGLF